MMLRTVDQLWLIFDPYVDDTQFYISFEPQPGTPESKQTIIYRLEAFIE